MSLRASFLIAVGLICVLAPPLAAQTPAPQPPQGNPRLLAEHRRLAFLMGQWDEEITYAGREPADAKGQGRWQARPEMGLYLALRYEGWGPEGEYHAMGVLTWDREQQAYRLWWFDDAGGIGEYRGNFRDENSLVLEHHGKVDGRDFRERITYTRAAPGEVHTRIEQAYGNEDYKLYLEAVAHRTEMPQRPGARPMQRPGGNPPPPR